MDLIFTPVPTTHIADYIVIGIFLCVCMGIGIYYGFKTNKQSTLENYFFGNRRLLLVPVSLSFFVTFQSAIALMGTPAEVYVYGIRGIFMGFALIFSYLIASFTVVPLFYPLKLTSTYEYLQLRFKSKSVRTLATLMGMLQTVAYLGVTLYAPALALQTVAGIPMWLSVVVIGLIGTIYTAIGGIKSVVWTDVFQSAMIFVGLAAVAIKGSLILGNGYPFGQIAKQGKRLEFFNFDPDPRIRHTMWGLTIGLSFSFLSNWCSQSSMQRISSLRSLQSARRTLLMQIPITAVFVSILGYLGIILYSYYSVLQCDPVKGGFLASYDQLMPYFVLDIFRSIPGLSGIYISCLFSGALSTLSSGINSLAANTVEDIIGERLKKLRVISYTFAAKIFVFIYGLVVIALAYGINFMSGNVIQMTMMIFGAFGGPMSGLFFLGGLISRANWIGAIVGSLSALAFNLWIIIGTQMNGRKPVKLPLNPTSGCYGINATYKENIFLNYNHSDFSSLNATIHGSAIKEYGSSSYSQFFLYNLSYTWYGMMGFILTLVIGSLVSCCTGCDRGNPVEARLLFPFCRKFCSKEQKKTASTDVMEQMNMIPPANIETGQC